jgi:hypothetical protein
MRRLLVAVGLVSVLATGVVAAGQSKGAKPAVHPNMTFTVKLIQEATYRHPHPPDGNAGDVFSTTLRLFAVGPLFGKPDKAYVGTMSFSYTFQGACSSAGVGCKGTTNLDTLSKLPGGTITANGNNVSLGRLPYVVPIVSGTGAFVGASGTVSIAPSGAATEVYTIKFK